MPRSSTPSDGQTSIPIPKVRRGLSTYFKEVGREMKKVNWPPRQETNRLTGVVLAVCALVVGVLVILNYFWAFVVDSLTKGF